MDQIIPVSLIQEKARAAFARGADYDEHNFNWHAPARQTWQQEWERCAAEARRDKASKVHS